MKEQPETPNNEATRSVSMHKWRKFNKLTFGLFLAAFVVLGAFLVINSSAAGKPSGNGQGTKTQQTPNLSLSPSAQKVAKGSSLSVQVWADAGNQSVNAVQANLTYPADKLDFVNIDDTTSNFSVAAQATGGSGKVAIARGSIMPLSGKQLVAKINFTANVSKSKAAVSFDSSSALISSSANTNVLAATYGGNYSLSQ
jgi:hypothetical protein